jgi:hypothetical protein
MLCELCVQNTGTASVCTKCSIVPLAVTAVGRASAHDLQPEAQAALRLAVAAGYSESESRPRASGSESQ